MSKALSETEALDFLRTWKPASDVYAFRHGAIVLTTSTFLSGAFINMRFRQALKLKNFAFFSTYCASVIIPSFASALLHGLVVVNPLLSNRVTCPVCLETRSALTQVMCSVVYPAILSPLACIPFADRYMTMAIPSLTQEPMLVLKKVVNILKPISKRLLIIAAVQVVIGGALAHCEFSNLFTVVEKVEQMEEVLRKTLPEEEMKSIREAAMYEDDKIHPSFLRKHIFSDN